MVNAERLLEDLKKLRKKLEADLRDHLAGGRRDDDRRQLRRTIDGEADEPDEEHLGVHQRYEPRDDRHDERAAVEPEHRDEIVGHAPPILAGTRRPGK